VLAVLVVLPLVVLPLEELQQGHLEVQEPQPHHPQVLRQTLLPTRHQSFYLDLVQPVEFHPVHPVLPLEEPY
jgi:hypothetical protein